MSIFFRIISGLLLIVALVVAVYWPSKMLDVQDQISRSAQVDHSIPILELLEKYEYDHAASTQRFAAIDDRSDAASTVVPVTFYRFSNLSLTPDTIQQFFEEEGMEPATLREACIALDKEWLVSEDFCVIALGTQMRGALSVLVDGDSTIRFSRLTYYYGVKGAQMVLNNPVLYNAKNYYAAKPKAKQT